jgi:hypothetical protein
VGTGWRGRQGAVVGLLSLGLAVAACDAPQVSPQSSAGTKRTRKQSAPQTKKSPGGKNESGAKGQSFTVSAGSVTVRRVGFDTLRVVRVRVNSGWRRRIDSNFDDSVEVEFLKGPRNLDVKAALENGRMTAEACQTFARLSTRPTIGDAATVALQRIGDEDLHVSIVKTSPRWHARITDNNSDDVEVLFLSNQGKVTFEAQLDDGRLEGSTCKRLP